tara:strand:+ start:705 stop:878 length:174 start_codon:yes stop_codon:yes gene_type:complete
MELLKELLKELQGNRVRVARRTVALNVSLGVPVADLVGVGGQALGNLRARKGNDCVV